MSNIYSWLDSDPSVPELTAICCPECKYLLTLHQPDADLPDRLLATCEKCKSWFLTNSDGIALMRLSQFPDDATPKEPES